MKRLDFFTVVSNNR